MGNIAQKLQGTVYVNQPALPTSLSDTSAYAQRLLTPVGADFTQAADYEWSDYNAGYLKYEKRLNQGVTVS